MALIQTVSGFSQQGVEWEGDVWHIGESVWGRGGKGRGGRRGEERRGTDLTSHTRQMSAISSNQQRWKTLLYFLSKYFLQKTLIFPLLPGDVLPDWRILEVELWSGSFNVCLDK